MAIRGVGVEQFSGSFLNTSLRSAILLVSIGVEESGMKG